MRPAHHIIVPTRNRESLVLQSLGMMEGLASDPDILMVVSDNSDGPNPKLEAFCAARSIQYIRPEKALSMAQHWDWIIKSLDWSAITFVSDRSFLVEDVFRQMAALHKRTGKAVVCGTGSLAFKTIAGRGVWKFSGPYGDGEAHCITGQQLKDAARQNLSAVGLPLLFKSIVPRSDWDRTLARFPDTFSSYGPDAEFAFKRIHALPEETSYFLDRIGVVEHSSHVGTSAGGLLAGGNAASRDFFTLNALTAFEHSPVPADLSPISSILHEYNKAAHESGQSWKFSAEDLTDLKKAENVSTLGKLTQKFLPLFGLHRNQFAVLGRGSVLADVPRATFGRTRPGRARSLPWQGDHRPS